ncbi:MAG: hypothetical protein BWY57_03185 [Betaproteobacteria bacterium ADurb.Bin341]|nr:MAG: hypothetical protein BWY57_03185 [Betaproteobacteria bacterium ADurb.Bin341]
MRNYSAASTREKSLKSMTRRRLMSRAKALQPFPPHRPTHTSRPIPMHSLRLRRLPTPRMRQRRPTRKPRHRHGNSRSQTQRRSTKRISKLASRRFSTHTMPLPPEPPRKNRRALQRPQDRLSRILQGRAMIPTKRYTWVSVKLCWVGTTPKMRLSPISRNRRNMQLGTPRLCLP